MLPSKTFRSFSCRGAACCALLGKVLLFLSASLLAAISSLFAALLKLSRQKLDQIAATAGIAPLVVVPSQNFYALVAHHFGVLPIHNPPVRIALEIPRHQFLFPVTQNSLQQSLTGGPQ